MEHPTLHCLNVTERQVAELTQQLQTIMQQLSVVTDHLAHMSAPAAPAALAAPPPPAPPTSSIIHRTLSIPSPAPYAGEVGDVKGEYPDDVSKIHQFTLLLRGRALSWARAVIDSRRSSPPMFDQFVIDFTRTFDQTESEGNIISHLMSLRQDSWSVADFSVEFRVKAVESGWNRGGTRLPVPCLYDDLAVHAVPAPLDGLIDQAVGLDNREEWDLYERKTAAAEFFRVNRVPEEVERALNQLLVQQPRDLYGYLADYFTSLSAPPRISRLKGREVYDARGQPSVEAEVFCIVCNKEKSMSSAAVPRHFTSEETSQERVAHVTTAIHWINEALNIMLNDQDPCEQSEIDHILRNFLMACTLEEKEVRNREKQENLSPSESEVLHPSPPPTPIKGKKSNDKGRKNVTIEKQVPPAESPDPVLCGSIAVGSVSLAVAKSGAHIKDMPLYKYTATLKDREASPQFHVPVCLVTLFSCGKSSPGKLNLLEEVILIPKVGQRVKEVITMTLELQKEMMRIMNTSTKAGSTRAFVSERGTASFERAEEPLDLITEACANLRLVLGTEIHLAINCAAPGLMDYSKGKYEVSRGVLKSPDELVDMYQTLINKYPAVVSLIDPFRREDRDQWEKLSGAIGNSCSLLSDVTYRPEVPVLLGARGWILKHTQETTVSDLICTTLDHKGSLIMGATCSEPCSDDSLSDIAVGLGMDYIKLGGLSSAESLAKYNRLICIEEELAQQGILVWKEDHHPPLFLENLPEQPAAEETVVSGPLNQDQQDNEADTCSY
ncbi:enolase 4 [Pholidichthys leucotaenia]